MDILRVSAELFTDHPFRSYPNMLLPKINVSFDIMTRLVTSGSVTGSYSKDGDLLYVA